MKKNINLSETRLWLSRLFSVFILLLLCAAALPAKAQTSDAQLFSLLVKGGPLTADQTAAIEKLQLQSAQKLNRRAALIHQTVLKPKAKMLVKKKSSLSRQMIKTSQLAALQNLSQLAAGDAQQLSKNLKTIQHWSNTYNGVDFRNGHFGGGLTITGPVTYLWPNCFVGNGTMGAPVTTYSPATPNESVPVLVSFPYPDAMSNPMNITGGVQTQAGWFTFSNPDLPPQGTPSLQQTMSQIGVTLRGAYNISSTTGIFETLCTYMDSGNSQFVTQGSEVLQGGNHGHYEMKLQVLVMNAQGLPVTDTAGAVSFVDAGPIGTLDLYGPNSNQPGAVGSGGFTFNFNSASATFTQIANVARVAVRAYLGDTRIGPQAIDDAPSFVNNSGNNPIQGYRTAEPVSFAYPNNNAVWDYKQPFEVDVIPTEMVQVKYMPLAILYAPPGNESYADYTVSNTYASTFTVQDMWSSKFTNSTVNESTFALSFGGSLQGAGGPSGGYSNQWDETTTAVNGATTVSQYAYTLSATSSSTYPAQLDSMPNNDSELFNKQPFWADQYILIPHTQFAVWNYQPSQGGDGPALNIMQLIGIPNAVFPASVAQLADCAMAGSCSPETSLNTILTGQGYDALSPYEASRLLSLDPFYMAQWQGWPGQTGSNPPVPATNTGGRGSLIRSTSFGAQSGAGVTVNAADLATIQQTLTQSSTSQLSTQSIYNSSVEADFKQTTTAAGNFSFSPVSLVTATAGITSTSSTTTKNTTEMDFSQLLNTQKSIVNTVTVTGELGNSGSEIGVNIYQDLLYGGLMFQDIHEPQPPAGTVP